MEQAQTIPQTLASDNFIDHVKLCFRSGDGGSGGLHFIREKFKDKGGPDGGNGGRGGHIILRGNSQLWTLLHLKYRKHIIAEKGQNGSSANCTGKEGEDIYLDVPLGTTVFDEDGNLRFEITEHGQEVIAAPGGRGGLGNEHFKTSTNQAPRHAQTGGQGTNEWLVLELKLLADVGLVGFPNAGKSTLLSVVSAAKPEIADYPFTTLTPNLGVVAYRDFRSFVMADIPGIIEGAAEGRGLGTRFLRHIERNSTLLFMIPADAESIKEQYKILLNELKEFNPELIDKSRILAITKCDMLDAELLAEMQKEVPEGIKSVFISSVSGMGIDKLKDMIWEVINEDKNLNP